MVTKAKNVKGLQVFSLKQNKKIATIHDLISSADGHKITALTVDKRGSFADTRVIAMGDVKSIGEDALVVESESSVKNVSAADKGIQQMVRDHIYIIGTAVITGDGVALGKIADVSFDAKTGSVEEVEITQGPIKDVSEGRKKIHGKDIVSVGKSDTVVKSDTDERLAAKPRGGLTGMMQNMQKKVSDVVEKTPFKDKKKK